MKDFLKRMLNEQTELESRIRRAKKAVENPPYGASAESIRMLAEQVKGMESYHYWLSERIKYHKE